MSFKTNVKGRTKTEGQQMKTDRKSSPCHYVTGELKKRQGSWDYSRPKLGPTFIFKNNLRLPKIVNEIPSKHYCWPT